MRSLRHTVPLGPGETPASFASRLAALNGPSARDLCLDFGTQFQKVVDGDPEALAIIAAKGSVPADALAANAFVRTGERRYRFHGEELTRTSLRRSLVVGCPACLTGDIAAAPQLKPRVAAFQRAIWQVAAVKTCPIHEVPLVVLANDMTPGRMHDWTAHITAAIPELPRLMAEARPRPLTGLETYIVARLSDAPARNDLLDPLPLYVAIAACEPFGAVAAFGRTVNLKTLTDEDWRVAGGAGFDILAGGVAGAHGFLEALQATYPYSGAATEGPQAVLGRIYQTLEFYRDDAAYDPLRDLVGGFIRTRFPVGPGDVVFGKPVEIRLLHSIRTLSKQTGLHAKRLRKVLEASGVLADGSDGLADGNCLFDAQRGLMVGSEVAAATLSVRDAGVYLNAPRVQRDMLYRSGIIVPRIKGGEHGAADQFAPADLDAFLARLFEGAVFSGFAGPNFVDIPTAARLACRSSEEIVRAILDRRLMQKTRIANKQGYMALLVDIDEVRALVRGPDHGGLTGLQIKDKLSTTAKVVAAVIKHGHLKSMTVVNPVNRCPTVIVTTAEVARFEREFVSLFALARQQRRHHMLVKKEIDAAGVKPALDPEKVGATFYRRDQVAKMKTPEKTPQEKRK